MRRKLLRRVVGACATTALVGGAVLVGAAAPAGAAGTTASFFNGGTSSAAWVDFTPAPGGASDTESIALSVTATATDDFDDYAGFDVDGVDDSAPATPPTFDFRPTVSGDSGGGPRLVIAFSDTGNLQLRPLTWTADTWSTVDGAGATNWDNNGGTCGFLFGTSYTAGLACHTGTAVTGVFVVTDSGWKHPGGYTNYVDNVSYDGLTIQSPPPPPPVAPGAPTNVKAGASASATANVSFTPPVDTGSGPITGYEATCGAVTKAGTASPVVVKGLANGVPITCKVRARNAEAGFGPYSADVPFTPGVPWGPTSVTGGPGPITGSVVVNWNAAQTNGAPITGYVVTCTPWNPSFPTRAVSVGGAKRTVQVNGLAPGQQHTCSIVAANSRGPGNPRVALPVGMIVPKR